MYNTFSIKILIFLSIYFLHFQILNQLLNSPDKESDEGEIA